MVAKVNNLIEMKIMEMTTVMEETVEVAVKREVVMMMKGKMMMVEVAGELQETIETTEEAIVTIETIDPGEDLEETEGATDSLEMIGIAEEEMIGGQVDMVIVMVVVIVGEGEVEEDMEEEAVDATMIEIRMKKQTIQDYSWEDLQVMKLKIKPERLLVNLEKLPMLLS